MTVTTKVWDALSSAGLSLVVTPKRRATTTYSKTNGRSIKTKTDGKRPTTNHRK